MNRSSKIEERKLKRNGSGYWDPTAYEAIKKADAELEGKKKTKKKTGPVRGAYYGPYEQGRAMSIKQYRKYKLKVLDELGIELTDEEKAYFNVLETEYEMDQYAHRLIMKGD